MKYLQRVEHTVSDYGMLFRGCSPGGLMPVKARKNTFLRRFMANVTLLGTAQYS